MVESGFIFPKGPSPVPEKFRIPFIGPERDAETFDSAQRLLQQWYSSLIYFATGSERKMRAIQELGFREVHTIVSLDEAETAVYDLYHEDWNPAGSDLDREQTAEITARKKLEVARRLNPVPSNALAIALDTMAEVVSHHPDNKSFLDSIHLSMKKPENAENARQVILHTFQELVRSIILWRYELTKHNLDKKPIDRQTIEHRAFVSEALYGGNKRIIVRTGIAIKVPNDEKIYSTTNELGLNLRAIENLVTTEMCQTIYGDVENKQALVKKLYNDTSFADVLSTRLIETGQTLQDKIFHLVDEIVKIMGDNIINISGGIDYSNPKIIELLGVEPFSTDQDSIEQGTLTGFPTLAVRRALSDLAYIKVREK